MESMLMKHFQPTLFKIKNYYKNTGLRKTTMNRKQTNINEMNKQKLNKQKLNTHEWKWKQTNINEINRKQTWMNEFKHK